MGIIASNTVALFGVGSLLGIGVTSAYFTLRFKDISEEGIGTNATNEQIENADPDDEYKLIMGVRNDLKMQKGKVAAQCGHAAVAAYAKALKERPNTLEYWLDCGEPKIALRVDSEEELLALHAAAQQHNVLSSVIRDAGQTQVAPGTRTVIAIGPGPKHIIDRVSGHLKLY